VRRKGLTKVRLGTMEKGAIAQICNNPSGSRGKIFAGKIEIRAGSDRNAQAGKKMILDKRFLFREKKGNLKQDALRKASRRREGGRLGQGPRGGKRFLSIWGLVGCVESPEHSQLGSAIRKGS